jgi:hypothetical protein
MYPQATPRSGNKNHDASVKHSRKDETWEVRHDTDLGSVREERRANPIQRQVVDVVEEQPKETDRGARSQPIENEGQHHDYTIAA